MTTFDTNGSIHSNGSTPRLFQRGGPGGPGRPTKAREGAMLDALKANFPPERIAEMLDLALDLAVKTNSWRGIVAVTELVLSYAVGKPKQRIETTADASLSDLLAGIDTSRPLLGDHEPA